ncbi:MAG: hypothetical protein ACFFBD_00040 [Candidatus Hodarchaeota archaeon]
MNQKRMYLKRLRQDKKGQARAIDFLIAFSLFILFMAQVLVLMSSLQYQIVLEKNPEATLEEAFILADKILRTPGNNDTGSKDWGDTASVPTIFGLADSLTALELNWSEMYSLDPAKIARINPYLESTISPTLKNYWLPYETVKNLLEVKATEEFSIEMLPAFNLTLATSSGASGVDVVAKVWDNKKNRIADASVIFYAKSIDSGEGLIPSTTILTNSTGVAEWSFTASAENYIVLASANFANLWTTAQIFCDGSTGAEITVNPEHMFFTTKQLAYHDRNTGTAGTCLLLYNGTSSSLSRSFSNETITIVNTTTVVSNNPGEAIFALVIDDNTVRVASIPSFFGGNYAYRYSALISPEDTSISTVSLVVSVNQMLIRTRIKFLRYGYGL